MSNGRWEYCISHKNDEVKKFIDVYFSQSGKKVLLIGGAGFDPRTCIFPKMLYEVLKEKIKIILIKEERPNPTGDLTEKSNNNIESLRSFISDIEIIPVDIFSKDLAVTGGITIVRELRQHIENGYTDIIFDQSAMSIGICFPLMRYALEMQEKLESVTNVHVVVSANAKIDQAIKSLPTDKAREVPGFKGGFGLSESDNAAKLWLPQLAFKQKDSLNQLYIDIEPHDICPILPFPATDPRVGDELLKHYDRTLLESWEVDPRNIIYAAENNPLDLYRTILRLDDERSEVFEKIRGSLMILSPSGSKIHAIGAFMAAVERNLPMRYIESVSYKVDWSIIDQYIEKNTEIIHLWLAGDAYTST